MKQIFDYSNQVILANFSALGVMMADINTILTTVSLSLAILFTAYKTYLEFHKSKKDTKK